MDKKTFKRGAIMKNERYWKIRAKRFNDLTWIKNTDILRELLRFSKFEPDDVVLDAGCRTGLLSKAIQSRVYKVAAMDLSPDMICQAPFEDRSIVPMVHDIEEPLEEFNDSFNKIISRSVFHHLGNVEKGVENCKNMLTKGGSLILQEGIPPSETAEVVSWFTHMMAIKEKRHVFTESSLIALFEKANFKNIECKIVVDSDFSVLNWLHSSGQNPLMLKRVYQAHKTAPESIKKLYRMRDGSDGDILIEVKYALIRGVK